jgi:broad specificity phosphatase PhoE
MAETTAVHVMRHGEVHNPKAILYGRLEGYGLSDRGRAQAEAAARALKDNDIVLVVASPLQRAQETAAPIAASHGLDIVTDPDVIESLNYFEGKRISPGDGALRDPRVWWQLRNPFKPSWGEPYKEIVARMTTAIDKARVKAAGHEAVCVTHQLPVEVLRRHLEGKWLPHDPRKRQCNLASLTSFVYDGDQLVDLRYDEPVGS